MNLFKRKKNLFSIASEFRALDILERRYTEIKYSKDKVKAIQAKKDSL